jgi:cell division protein FtsL
MRTLNLGVMALTLASAFLLYGINYDTRLMDQHLQKKERAIEKARGDIAILKAERAHLARPERIEPLARGLGLQPATERQIVANPQEALTRALAAGGDIPTGSVRGN